MLSLSACTDKSTVRLGTGGTYYAYGEQLSKLDSSIEVKTTAGSEANMRLLDKGFIDAAIVQSDSLDVSDGNLDLKVRGCNEINHLRLSLVI
ncbi:MAG: hypothetical protein E7279_09305 [Lachnospiraceae bacterium]|nr:hypothetical protein [Lachnospiraceae bacterium]